MKEAKPTVVASEPKAKEQLILMLMVVMLLVLTVLQFILLQICNKFGVDSAELSTF